MVTRLLRAMGGSFLAGLREMGRMFMFLAETVVTAFRPPFKFRIMMRQVRFLGNKSLLVVLLTGAFTGMVLALQIFHTLSKFGSEALLGPAVALSIIRELGPVLSALMVTGRGGSAMTAEIGIMNITEQISALSVMALSPIRYLIVPNLVAAVIVFPLLTAIFDIVGIYSGYLVGVELLGLSPGTYFSQMENFVDMQDIRIGLLKSLSFGVIVSWVCCYKGYYTDYGAEGVSKATTAAVVMSSVLILVWDYFLGSVMM
jgi:phospholipid/cholesterol/gamma-HCH transport system permease protein